MVSHATSSESPRTPLRFTVADYYRMARTGVLRPDRRYELIEGEIIPVMPPGPEHCANVASLDDFLHEMLAKKYHVRCQSNVRLSNISEPLPDIAIFKKRPDYYRNRPPGPADTLLLIEVADSSLSYDKNQKAAIYAAAGVVEYWIVNLRKRCLHVLRKPSPEGYEEILTFAPGDSVRALKVPELKVKVAALLLK